MRRYWLLLALAPLLPSPGAALGRLTFGVEELATWSHPRGLVTVTPGGVVTRRFGRTNNAVADLESYVAIPVGQHGTQPVWAQSGAATADLVRDGDPRIWWSPSSADPLLPAPRPPSAIPLLPPVVTVARQSWR